MTDENTVLYRKWRPGTFEQMAGQEHITRILSQAIATNRVSHSYLFHGTRGTGKTTTARVLAKALNCAQPQGGNPCDQCNSCQSISQGRNLDIIELDAATNRGVDQIREIREKVHYRPAQSRRKVYIIDEAHMLTRDASNAFLKTLEEPPSHAVFILCTTEAEQILPTIQSRCQRYDFRKLPPSTIQEYLTTVAQAEGYQADEPALRTIARHAEGSMRDALNTLEQLALHTDGVITLDITLRGCVTMDETCAVGILA